MRHNIYSHQVMQVQFVMHRTVVKIQQAQREKLQSFTNIQKAGTAQRERHQEKLDMMAPGNLQEKKVMAVDGQFKAQYPPKNTIPSTVQEIQSVGSPTTTARSNLLQEKE